jgi:hypothetical protein
MTPGDGVPPDDWNSDELKALLNQMLALEFVKLKHKAEPPALSPWLSIVQSIAPVIVTVLLGTILGGYLASRIQETSRVNDARQALQKANLAEEQKTVDAAFAVIGKTISASQDLIDITGEGFDENAWGLPADVRKDLVSQKRAIWKTYNSATASWRVERERLGMLLAIRYEDPKKVRDSWLNLSDAVDHFSECTLKYNKQTLGYNKPTHRVVPHDQLQLACEDQRKLLSDALSGLTDLMVKARKDLEPQRPPNPTTAWWHFW